jgi:hypothetical protein
VNIEVFPRRDKKIKTGKQAIQLFAVPKSATSAKRQVKSRLARGQFRLLGAITRINPAR